MSKKKIAAIVMSIIFIISGIIPLTIGIIRKNNSHTENLPVLDRFNLSEEDVGKEFRGTLAAMPFLTEQTDKGSLYLMCYELDENDENSEFIFLGFDVPDSSELAFNTALNKDVFDDSDFYGTLLKCDAEMTEKFNKTIADYFHNEVAPIYEKLEMNISEEQLNEEIKTSQNAISPYYIKVGDIRNEKLLIAIGSALLAIGLFTLLTALFRKKFLIAFFAAILLGIIILLISISGKLMTIFSTAKIDDGLYKMTCKYDCKIDELIDADIDTIEDYINWIIKEVAYGLPIEVDPDNFGCAAFTAASPDGQRLFGRNYDYLDTDTLVVYSEPKDGYASYGVADLAFFDINTEGGMDIDSPTAKLFSLAAPYACVDGINEKGVGIGILQLSTPEIHQDNGKKDFIPIMAIRVILDTCASVDEAIEYLESYDYHSFLGDSFHLYITDKTGLSVVVEWDDEGMFIVEDTGCTNDVLCEENEYYESDWECWRYDTIKERLADKENILTADEAMQLTDDIHQKNTEWSCVYNLDDFTFDICLDGKYDKKYTFTKEDFE